MFETENNFENNNEVTDKTNELPEEVNNEISLNQESAAELPEPEETPESTVNDTNEILLRGRIIGFTGNMRYTRLRVQILSAQYRDVPSVSFNIRKNVRFCPGDDVTIKGHFRTMTNNGRSYTNILGDEIIETEEYEDPLLGKNRPEDVNLFRVSGKVVENRKLDALSILKVEIRGQKNAVLNVSCFRNMDAAAQRINVGDVVFIEGRLQTSERETPNGRRINFENAVALRISN